MRPEQVAVSGCKGYGILQLLVRFSVRDNVSVTVCAIFTCFSHQLNLYTVICQQRFGPPLILFSRSYRKIPIISPGLIFVQKAFLLDLVSGEPIFGGAYYRKKFCVSKWVGLDNINSLNTTKTA